MLKKLFGPKWYCPNLYEIDFNVLKQNGINTIFFDLDNTLVPFYEQYATLQTKEFLNALKENDFTIFVISNNHHKRVATFANDLKINYLNSAYKPAIFRLKKLLKKNNLKKNQIVMVGDQLLTDVIAAKRLKVASILVEPAVKDDLKKTKLNRFFDKKIRNRLIKKNQMNYLRKENYE